MIAQTQTPVIRYERSNRNGTTDTYEARYIPGRACDEERYGKTYELVNMFTGRTSQTGGIDAHDELLIPSGFTRIDPTPEPPINGPLFPFDIELQNAVVAASNDAYYAHEMTRYEWMRVADDSSVAARLIADIAADAIINAENAALESSFDGNLDWLGNPIAPEPPAEIAAPTMSRSDARKRLVLSPFFKGHDTSGEKWQTYRTLDGSSVGPDIVQRGGSPTQWNVEQYNGATDSYDRLTDHVSKKEATDLARELAITDYLENHLCFYCQHDPCICDDTPAPTPDYSDLPPIGGGAHTAAELIPVSSEPVAVHDMVIVNGQHMRVAEIKRGGWFVVYGAGQLLTVRTSDVLKPFTPVISTEAHLYGPVYIADTNEAYGILNNMIASTAEERYQAEYVMRAYFAVEELTVDDIEPALQHLASSSPYMSTPQFNLNDSLSHAGRELARKESMAAYEQLVIAHDPYGNLPPMGGGSHTAAEMNRATSQKRDNDRAERHAINEAYHANATAQAANISDMLSDLGFNIASTKATDDEWVWSLWHDANGQASVKQTPYTIRIYNGRKMHYGNKADGKLTNRINHGWVQDGETTGYAAGIVAALLPLLETPDPLMQAIDAMEQGYDGPPTDTCSHCGKVFHGGSLCDLCPDCAELDTLEQGEQSPSPCPCHQTGPYRVELSNADMTERNGWNFETQEKAEAWETLLKKQVPDTSIVILTGGQPTMTGPWQDTSDPYSNLPAIGGGSHDADELTAAQRTLQTAVATRKLYTIRRIAKSGMTHYISVFAVIDGDLNDITWTLKSDTMNETLKDGWVVRRGGGMDMAYGLVNDIGRYAVKQGWLESPYDLTHNDIATV